MPHPQSDSLPLRSVDALTTGNRITVYAEGVHELLAIRVGRQ